jgi:co-chaperonin GroES (HSP10)
MRNRQVTGQEQCQHKDKQQLMLKKGNRVRIQTYIGKVMTEEIESM